MILIIRLLLCMFFIAFVATSHGACVVFRGRTNFQLNEINRLF